MNILRKIILYICFIITNLNSFAQNNTEDKKGKFGFLLKNNINFFQINTPSIDVKTELGWGIGNVYSKDFSRNMGIDAEAQVNFEKHTLAEKSNHSPLELKDINLALPLKLRLRLYKGLSFIAGAEYLYVLSKQNEELKLRKDNYLALAGASYAIKFKYFIMMPEIFYRLGLNNAIAESPLYDFELKRSSVSFGIKFM